LESIPGHLKSLKIPFLARRHNNPIPTWFLAPIECLKFPALKIPCDFFSFPPDICYIYFLNLVFSSHQYPSVWGGRGGGGVFCSLLSGLNFTGSLLQCASPILSCPGLSHVSNIITFRCCVPGEFSRKGRDRKKKNGTSAAPPAFIFCCCCC
jgi:hypothetical protein